MFYGRSNGLKRTFRETVYPLVTHTARPSPLESRSEVGFVNVVTDQRQCRHRSLDSPCVAFVILDKFLEASHPRSLPHHASILDWQGVHRHAKEAELATIGDEGQGMR